MLNHHPSRHCAIAIFPHSRAEVSGIDRFVSLHFETIISRDGCDCDDIEQIASGAALFMHWKDDCTWNHGL